MLDMLAKEGQVASDQPSDDSVPAGQPPDADAAVANSVCQELCGQTPFGLGIKMVVKSYCLLGSCTASIGLNGMNVLYNL